MTIQKRLEDKDLGLEYNDMGLSSGELRAQLTRVLALIEAAGVVRKSLHAADQEKYDECKWDALEGTQSLADAFDALVAAGDIEGKSTEEKR